MVHRDAARLLAVGNPGDLNRKSMFPEHPISDLLIGGELTEHVRGSCYVLPQRIANHSAITPPMLRIFRQLAARASRRALSRCRSRRVRHLGQVLVNVDGDVSECAIDASGTLPEIPQRPLRRQWVCWSPNGTATGHRRQSKSGAGWPVGQPGPQRERPRCCEGDTKRRGPAHPRGDLRNPRQRCSRRVGRENCPYPPLRGRHRSLKRSLRTPALAGIEDIGLSLGCRQDAARAWGHACWPTLTGSKFQPMATSVAH